VHRQSGIAVDGAAPHGQVVGLADYAAVLRRYRFLILLSLLLGGGAAVAYTTNQTPLYTSQAEVLIRPLGSFPTTQGTVNLETEVALVTSDAVAKRVTSELGGGVAVNDLLDGVTVTVPGGAEVLHISYTDAVPETARERAQAFAVSYLALRGELARDSAFDAAKTLEEEITELQVRLGSATRELSEAADGSADRANLIAERRALKDQISLLRGQLIQLSSFQVTPGEVVSSADMPISPSSPHLITNTVVGSLIGLFLGILAAFVRDRSAATIRGPEDVELLVGAPVIGYIPSLKARRRAREALLTVDSPSSPAAEAFRGLRTTLISMVREQDTRVILLTSASAREGKTTVAANLGVVLAEAGQRVLLISADMRAPRLHVLFGLPNWTGLTDILERSLPLSSAVLPSTVPGLNVLPTGPLPSRPVEMAQSRRMAILLQHARRDYDFVIIDATPVLPVADALALTMLVDAVLFVVDGRSASVDEVGNARTALGQVGASVLGVVLNRSNTERARYDGRYGSSGRTYPSDSDDGADGRGVGAPEEDVRERAVGDEGRDRIRMPPAPSSRRPAN
jgi:capsular exopolysaccharide synthesis family protein